MIFPQLIKIRRSFPSQHLEDIAGTVQNELAPFRADFPAGSSMAIAVGSRGIANIGLIVRSVVHYLQSIAVKPFIIPAMGSHGGGTAEGQEEILAGYGITEDNVGAPVRSSMEVVELPQGDLCHRIFTDKLAYAADGIIVINRIKVHTDFHGNTESGLLKMCVIGLGKHKQALEIHRYGVRGLRDLIPRAARQILQHGKIVLGLGLVENAYDQTMIIKAVKPDLMEAEEARLLEISRRNMPSLPVHQLDLLIIDEMGKEISGSGIDPNIIGRTRIRKEPEPETPDITAIIVTDLTEASHGNAVGIGLADFITRRLYEKIDFQATYENLLTSTFTERGKIPVIAATDREAAAYACRTWGPVEPDEARIIRIKNTLRLDEIYVSRSILELLPDAEPIGSFQESFDLSGNLLRF